MPHRIETDRLFLRELTLADERQLSMVLSDPDSMRYYPHPFSEDEVRAWIRWNIDNYRTYSFGLWAVILRSTNEFIGDCGITMQEIDGAQVPEIGYHIIKDFTKKGYATEAAGACKVFAFETLGMERICSYTTVDNVPSQRVARKIGMEFVRTFTKRIGNTDIEEMLFCATRD
tara:strand:- start:1710 stop:2228 length:519 start_codon:yes stop_codon:yes gene_type:complete